ncbi:glycosyltransferase family 4 protein [Oceanobacillus alkalisoli]|uniref:glycosyltransferase family 4 protein n=1 Tax=Oceanobacillus alkalisoli TaxID=2925113 RepID=UPI001F11B375|nr:glycosyltransferase family 4 protein [Oceanobacillus alkalisoli]MCF3942624.1 glycosyltransferase family 4 protein [Oceanobacillus alkalisoli]
MNVAISAIRTKNIRINRHELVTSLQDIGHDVYYVGQESKDELHPDYEKYNVQFIPISIGRSNTNPLKEIHTIYKVSKALKKNKINTIIVYGIRTFPTMVIAAKLAGVDKVLCVVNGSGRLFELKGIKGLLVKLISYPMLFLAFSLSDSILFQNKDDQNMIKRKGLLWKKNYSLVNGSGVNLQEYYPSKLETRPVFIMISRLTGRKGINEYMEAARQVKKKYPRVEFYLVGPMDDDDDSIDINRLQQLVNENVINIKGKTNDVRSYIKKSRVFVLPSYYPEGIPRSILEAMAMGRPIITTDSPGCRETVINGLNGFIVPPKDVDSLVEKMVWMIENESQVNKMGKLSRSICEEKFNVHEINKIMLHKLELL